MWLYQVFFFFFLLLFINIFCRAVCSATTCVIWHLSPFVLGFFFFSPDKQELNNADILSAFKIQFYNLQLMKDFWSRWRLWPEQEKQGNRGCMFQNNLPQISAFSTHAPTHTHTHTHSWGSCPSSSGSVVATPAASPPPVRFDSRGRIHHLLASLGASQLLPRGLTGERSWEALGWSLPSLGSSCVGDRQRCGADVRVWGQQKVRLISTSAMFVIPPFPGRKKTAPWSDSQLNT